MKKILLFIWLLFLFFWSNKSFGWLNIESTWNNGEIKVIQWDYDYIESNIDLSSPNDIYFYWEYWDLDYFEYSILWNNCSDLKITKLENENYKIYCNNNLFNEVANDYFYIYWSYWPTNIAYNTSIFDLKNNLRKFVTISWEAATFSIWASTEIMSWSMWQIIFFTIWIILISLFVWFILYTKNKI